MLDVMRCLPASDLFILATVSIHSWRLLAIFADEINGIPMSRNRLWTVPEYTLEVFMQMRPRGHYTPQMTEDPTSAYAMDVENRVSDVVSTDASDDESGGIDNDCGSDIFDE